MKFGIGVILYNPDKHVFSRLKLYERVSDVLYIIDNTEIENSNCRIIAREFDNYVRQERNLGMSTALNLIFERGNADEVDYLLTMDQDSDFSGISIKKMLDFIDNNDDSNISIFCPNYRKIYIDSNGEERFGPYAISTEDNKVVDFSMTSGSFCKMSEINKILPLTNLFIGYVDNDICYNLIIKNNKILMLGEIGFSQRVGGEVKFNLYNKLFQIIHHNEIRYYYMTRNNLYLQKKFKGNKRITFNLIANLFRIHINILIGEKDKVKKIKYSYKGYVDFKNGKIGKKI